MSIPSDHPYIGSSSELRWCSPVHLDTIRASRHVDSPRLGALVDITWLGHAAVRVRTRRAAVVFDPTDKSAGIDMGRPTGDIAVLSRVQHPHHNFTKGIKGTPIVVDSPGEYEILGTHIEGIRAVWPTTSGKEKDPPVACEPTTLFMCQAEELRFAHLGGLAEPPTFNQAEALTGVEILIMPVSLPNGLEAADAANIARTIDPKIVIPIGYRLDKNGNSKELGMFLEALGGDPEAAVSRLSVNRRNIGDTRRITLLESRG